MKNTYHSSHKVQFHVASVPGEPRALFSKRFPGIFEANGWDTQAEAEAALKVIASYDKAAVDGGWIAQAPILQIERF